MGDCGPSSFKGTVTGDRERSSKVAMGERGARRTLLCVKMSPKRRVHAVGGRGAQRKGLKIVKGISHEILNGVK